MSLPAPSMVDRAKNWIRRFKRRLQPPSIRPNENTGAGDFSNAHDFTINGGQFINANKMTQINHVKNIIANREAVFELLEPYACLDAVKDSSARDPPPRCHPETRLKIRERLMRWLLNEYDEWKMMWVRGPAGAGKSAVAQSFADSCEEGGIQGGTPARRNPTPITKLSTIQFRKLIVEPFAALQIQGPQKPIIVILDGLDECEGESDQRRILELITNAIRTNPDLPLRWLIFSRPEAHLKNAFSRNILCGREELIIDAECRENVERYVKDRLVEIKDAYVDVTPADWPSLKKLQELIDAVSGLFIFASTCLNFIADPEKANPPSQLDLLLKFMRRSQGVGSRSPLAALDLLYSQILEKISPQVYETTRRILAFMSHRTKLDNYERLSSAQTLSNFLRLDQHTFYGAARGLHSVMSIPEPNDAAGSRLRFYHASFQDFLFDPNRSGKFAIGEQDALAYYFQLRTYWCQVDATHFHTNDGWNFDRAHKHDGLPGLTWVSEDNRLSISKSITNFLDMSLFRLLDIRLVFVNGDLLIQFLDIDFRCWYSLEVFTLARLCQLNPSTNSLTSFVRIEPCGPMDHQLLEYFNLVIGNGVAKPAQHPLRNVLPNNEWIREYFIIGHGVKSVIVWTTKSPISPKRWPYSLRCDQEPAEAQISAYQAFLQKIEWDEARAKLEMR